MIDNSMSYILKKGILGRGAFFSIFMVLGSRFEVFYNHGFISKFRSCSICRKYIDYENSLCCVHFVRIYHPLQRRESESISLFKQSIFSGQ